MSKVKNSSCIRKISLRSLRASRKRNRIAVIAIALTAMLFTALFTIALSINASYQEYTFRQMGGYSHGTFKDVNEEQIQALSAHPKVKQTGVRTVIGYAEDGVFARDRAEVSYMDENCTRWSYALPTTGKMPESEKEISMDTTALELLGVEPELGAEVTLTYTVGDMAQISFEETDTFVLSGYWEFDEVMPVHYINISKTYADEIGEKAMQAGMDPFRSDLNVMMASSIGIRAQMEQVDRDLGYSWEDRYAPNAARIGVSWAYTTERLAKSMDPETLVGVIAFLLLIVFTGYLIIYNIFQISVSNDVRYYGLLKTIGVTPRQLRRIIRWQAFFLSVTGIPAGLLAGFGIGAALTPFITKTINATMTRTTIKVSPWIFLIAAVFTLLTVLISCGRPGRLAAKVSPVEAVKYTESSGMKKTCRRTRKGGVRRMALANLQRSRKKTLLVILSLSLSVVLLDILSVFVGGFDMEKYLDRTACADFIVSSPEYFRYDYYEGTFSEETGSLIEENTVQSLSGYCYMLANDYGLPQTWMTEETWLSNASEYIPEQELEVELHMLPRRGELVGYNAQIEGIDENLFEKLTVLKGDLSSLSQKGAHGIAIDIPVDDYGNPMGMENYPAIGETLTVTYINESRFIDTRTGELSDDATPREDLRYEILDEKDVEYTVDAYVTVPYSMSFRRYSLGYDLILPAERLREDSDQTVVPMLYLFDTPDPEAEKTAEQFMEELAASDTGIQYESKSSLREDFEGFEHMFLYVGALLCAIIGLVGILNFFHAIMTGILSRKREFAVLQAVGMTGGQLCSMLVCEGMIYALGSFLLALFLSLILNPLIGSMMETMFWFFSPHLTVLPVLLVIPVFLLLGWLIPSVLYRQAARYSVVERLREIG